MLKHKLLIVSGMLTCSLLNPIWAQTSVPYGWYVEGNVGSSRQQDSNYPVGSSSSSSGIGGNASLGYKFMTYFATEFGYTLYANTSINDSTGTKAGTDKHYSYDLAGKAILPISMGGFELFAKCGVQRLYSSISINNPTAANNLGLGRGQHNKTGPYLGAGGEYYFSPEFAVVAQWTRAVGSSATGTMDLFSVGLSFIFNANSG